MSKDLLIYTTIANRSDNIKYSVLIDPETKTASMPSLATCQNNEEKSFADNANFIINQLLPALKAYVSCSFTLEQLDTINNLWWPTSENETILNVMSETIDILEYAIENNLLTETM